MPGSLADRLALETYYDNLRDLLPEVMHELPIAASYLGERPSWFWRNATDIIGSPRLYGRQIDCIDTEEVSIDTHLFSTALLSKVRHNKEISLLCNTKVISAEQQHGGFNLNLEGTSSNRQFFADLVINCSWIDRVRLDQTVGMSNQNDDLSYRVKHRIIVRPAYGIDELVPVTMVQGPYGDVVPFKNGTVYLSWYPECRTYFGSMPPKHELTNNIYLNDISKRTIDALSEMFPSLINAQVLSCKPCMIVAEGMSDVDNKTSALHSRSMTGPRRMNEWWSVDTGKLTLAPLHAENTVSQILKEVNQ